MQHVRAWTPPEPLLDVIAEHLEEAAWLFGARARCNDDPELSWEDLYEREQRLDAHLAGAILAGRAAVDLLAPFLFPKEDETDASAVAGAVFPGVGLIEPMEWLVEALVGESLGADALVDGMRYSRAPSLSDWAGDFLSHEHPVVRAAGAALAVDRQLLDDATWTALAGDKDPRVALSVLAAAEPERLAAYTTQLERWVLEAPLAQAESAASLLGQARGVGAAPTFRARIAAEGDEGSGRLPLFLAVVGAADDAGWLIQRAGSSPDARSLVAAALTGQGSATEVLLENLDPERGEAVFLGAVQALRVLTGVDLLPEFDLEEPEPDELQAFRDQWQQAASERAAGGAALRWRRGRGACPSLLASELLRSGNDCRGETHFELRARYGCPLPFSLTHRFEQQAQSLQSILTWASEADARFEPGLAYDRGEALAR